MRICVRSVAMLLAAAAITTAAASGRAQEASGKVFDLEPEYVYGRDRRPQIGYRKPEVFDPLSDRLYQSGYRNFAPTAIPDELKTVPAMERGVKMPRLLAAPDAWFCPFRRTANNNQPAVIEVEILQAIAKRRGWDASIA